jgi:pilus assembly protein CpaB
MLRRAHLGAFLNRWPRRLAALTCLLLAAASALAARQPTPPSAPPATAVVIAARSIPAGTDLASADVRVIRWPRSLIPAGTAAAVGTLVGKRVSSAVARGEPITTARLVGADLAAGLPVGQVAVPVSLADPNAAALIRAGDHVDLLVAPADATANDPPAGTGLPVTGAATSGSGGAVAVALRVLVLALLPARSEADSVSELIIATDRATALRIATVANRPILAIRDDHP